MPLPGLPPADLDQVPITKRLDGSGYCLLRMVRGNLDYFGLRDLPTPKDYGIKEPGSDRRFVRYPTKNAGPSVGYYRIAYEMYPGGSKPRMSRFTLTNDPVMETLKVLTEYLNSSGVTWLWLCNRHGGKLSTNLAFTSTNA